MEESLLTKSHRFRVALGEAFLRYRTPISKLHAETETWILVLVRQKSNRVEGNLFSSTSAARTAAHHWHLGHWDPPKATSWGNTLTPQVVMAFC
jgi:hypothetical protein